MSAVVLLPAEDGALPLLAAARPRPFAHVGGRTIDSDGFLADVAALAAELPAASNALNLCEDRYRFIVTLAAAALRGQTTLLPPSRAPEVIAETRARFPGCSVLIDHDAAPQPPGRHRIALPAEPESVTDLPTLAGAQPVLIGFTSGSTGLPKPQLKRWAGFRASSARNVALLAERCGLSGDACAHIVATVPPQHMYGIEMTVLLPLLGPFAVHAGRPFFPAEVAAALAEVPAPRLLVTTPVHLRALLRSGQPLPALAAIVSATAPLPAALAREAEARYGAPVQEVFGSTETCVIGHRRTAASERWQLHDDVRLTPRPDGTLVSAPWFDAPILLQDLVELQPPDGFVLRGRHADLLEIAGKRASLAELTARLQALPGVEDAVVFQAEAPDAGGVHRIVALVVAPGRRESELLAGLRAAVDPVFLPRPLKLVDRLPRNETGKLPRAALEALL